MLPGSTSHLLGRMCVYAFVHAFMFISATTVCVHVHAYIYFVCEHENNKLKSNNKSTVYNVIMNHRFCQIGSIQCIAGGTARAMHLNCTCSFP